MLPNLQYGSAIATVRERSRLRAPPQSSIAYFEHAAVAIYNGDRRSGPTLDPKIVEKIVRLSTGVSKRFAHAEIRFADDNGDSHR